MRKLLLLGLFLPSVCFAANWVRVADIAAGSKAAYELEKACKEPTRVCSQNTGDCTVVEKACEELAGRDIETLAVVDGKLVVDPVKAQARADALAADEQERNARLARIQLIKDYFALSSPTAAQTQAAVKALAREVAAQGRQ